MLLKSSLTSCAWQKPFSLFLRQALLLALWSILEACSLQQPGILLLAAVW